ncbi:MAG TPA: indole-3-glycerol phosphate synthase TrpC [Pilimelia sp.]|nr:indole-3-glycerol phosphate synthase TrpC [Pilimelia sp.]
MHLDEIVARKRKAWASTDPPYRIDRGRTRPAQPGRFAAALVRPDVSIIAEVKPRSPSKGDLWPADRALPLANAYREGGARAVSVLADEPFFGGSPDLVRAVAGAVDVPVLFKDFVVDPRQVTLAHSCDADAVLVIARAVDDARLADILAAAGELGIDALVETFTAGEVDRALRAGARIVGVNNRDLDTFTVDLDNALRLRRLVPDGVVTVSESGIRDRADVERVAAQGFDACLIGETLLTSEDPARAVAGLVGVAAAREVAA